ncbi:hypothetical protein FRB99_002698 [Tulasnella sp. 403]|nr:hypothetical protein FRB99_002698 [Tulasnella sp. 403]
MARTKDGSGLKRARQATVDETVIDSDVDDKSQPTNKVTFPNSKGKGKGKEKAIVVDHDEDEDVQNIESTQRTAKVASTTRVPNGKGTLKVGPPKKPKPDTNQNSPSVVADSQMNDEGSNGQPRLVKKPPSSSQSMSPTRTSNRKIAQLERLLEQMRRQNEFTVSKLEKENERLRNENETLQQERDTFAGQFKTLSQLRTTEAEAERDELRDLMQETIAAKDAIIENVMRDVQGMEDLTRADYVHGLKLLTREARDAKITELKSALHKKGEELAEAEQKVQKLSEQVETLKFDLAQEKEHFAQEQARQASRKPMPPLHPSSSPSRANGPTTRVVVDQSRADKLSIQLLQDLSGCVILSATPEQSATDGSTRWRYRCLYPFNETDSLTFDLVSVLSNGEEEILYTPITNMEPRPSREFLSHIDYLARPFSFARPQLLTLGRELMNRSMAEEEADGGDEDEEEVNTTMEMED